MYNLKIKEMPTYWKTFFYDNFNLNFQKEIVAKLCKQIKFFIHSTAGFIIIV